ncbi:response regulator [Planctomycetota bacterium]|nr:response regulator [Planctomycetota bacterium]
MSRRMKKSIVLLVQREPRLIRKWAIEELATPALASTLQEARELLVHTIPDAIFIDDELPDGRGISLLQDIRKSKHHKGTPVVLVATKDDLQMIEFAVMSGIYACVKYPLDETECKRTLRKAMTGRTGRVEY